MKLLAGWRGPLLCLAFLGCTRPNPSFVGPGSRDVSADAEDAAPRADPGTASDGPDEPPDQRQDQLVDVLSAEPASPDAPTSDTHAAGLDSAGPEVADSSLRVGLVARYRLDPSGGNVVPDDSGARNGTRSGGVNWTSPGFPATEFPNGGALSFDGTTGFVTLPASGLPAVSGDKSVSLWFRQPVVMNNFARRTILTLANPGASVGLHLGLQRGVPSVWVWSQSAEESLLAHSSTQGTAWTHVVYTHGAGRHVLYLDGFRVDSRSLGYGDGAPCTLALLGAWSTTMTIERWSGLIDDVRVYARALTPAEVSALAAGAP